MEQNSLSKWLRLVLVGLGICLLMVYLFIIPSYGRSLVYQYPEFSNRYWPWLIFLWVTGLPCYTALYFGWKISTSIGMDRSFSLSNAKLLKWISWLAAGDSVFFFIGNVILLLFNMSHPGVALLSLLVVFAGIAVAVAAAALSYLVQKAAVLQDQSDWTI